MTIRVLLDVDLEHLIILVRLAVSTLVHTLVSYNVYSRNQILNNYNYMSDMINCV